MLGGSLPVSAPLQSYSKLDDLFEIPFVTYTETNQEEQEKGVLKANFTHQLYNCFKLKKVFSFPCYRGKENTFLVIEHTTNTSFQNNRSRLCNCPERSVAVLSTSFLCRFSNFRLYQSREWMGYCRVFSIELRLVFVSCVLFFL